MVRRALKKDLREKMRRLRAIQIIQQVNRRKSSAPENVIPDACEEKAVPARPSDFLEMSPNQLYLYLQERLTKDPESFKNHKMCVLCCYPFPPSTEKSKVEKRCQKEFTNLCEFMNRKVPSLEEDFPVCPDCLGVIGSVTRNRRRVIDYEKKVLPLQFRLLELLRLLQTCIEAIKKDANEVKSIIESRNEETVTRCLALLGSSTGQCLKEDVIHFRSDILKTVDDLRDVGLKTSKKHLSVRSPRKRRRVEEEDRSDFEDEDEPWLLEDEYENGDAGLKDPLSCDDNAATSTSCDNFEKVVKNPAEDIPVVSESCDDDVKEEAEDIESDSEPEEKPEITEEREEISKVKLPRIYRCSLCPQIRFRMNVVGFMQHMIFHNDNPLQCLICKTFMPRDPDNFAVHWNKFHGFVRKQFRYRLVRPSFQQIFRCDICKKLFSSILDRDAHAKKAHDTDVTKPLECKCCRNCFSCMHELRLHQARDHPDEVAARFSCSECDENFVKIVGADEEQTKILDEGKLSQHISFAHGSLDIPILKSCPLCGEICGKTGNSFFHLLSKHSDLLEVSYVCSICAESFKTPQDHQEHVKTSHNPDQIVNSSLLAIATHRPFRIVKTTPDVLIECGMCPSKPVGANVTRRNGVAHMNHLKQQHCMSLDQKIAEGTNKSKLGYFCPSCPHIELSMNDLFLHATFHYRRPYKCVECSCRLSKNPLEVEKHWDELHRDSPVSSIDMKYTKGGEECTVGNIWKCFRCEDTSFSLESELDLHNENTHKDDNNSCEDNNDEVIFCGVCSKRFADKRTLCLHKAIDHPDVAILSCFFCNERFSERTRNGIEVQSTRMLREHMKQAHGFLLPHECGYCGILFERWQDLRDHLVAKYHIGISKWFKCSVCYTGFDGQIYLEAHFKKVHCNSFCCEICGLELKSEKTLQSHKLLKHGAVEGLTVFKCEKPGCAYQTVRSGCLVKHNLTHQSSTTRERRFTCRVCGKSFFTMCHMLRHEEIHANATTKPFQCELCGNSFALRNYLYIHKRLSHGGKKFPSTSKKKTRPKKKEKTTDNPHHLDTPVNEEVNVSELDGNDNLEA